MFSTSDVKIANWFFFFSILNKKVSPVNQKQGGDLSLFKAHKYLISCKISKRFGGLVGFALTSFGLLQQQLIFTKAISSSFKKKKK